MGWVIGIALPSKIPSPWLGSGFCSIFEGVARFAINLTIGTFATSYGIELFIALNTAKARLMIAANSGDHPLGFENLD